MPSVLALILVLPLCAEDMVHPAHGAQGHGRDGSARGLARSAPQIMKQGGNAVDAAVAVGFALEVVYPEAGNIGGGGFMLFRRADGEVHFLDYREKAPAKATADMYLDKQGNIVPDLSTHRLQVDLLCPGPLPAWSMRRSTGASSR